jgi:hypothetical protein
MADRPEIPLPSLWAVGHAFAVFTFIRRLRLKSKEKSFTWRLSQAKEGVNCRLRPFLCTRQKGGFRREDLEALA